jgi:phage baseplate assembly protein W
MASVREKNDNDDIFIGIRYPLGFSPDGFFYKTKTILEQAKANLRNLLLTSKGERVMQPEFGSRLLDIVFDQGVDIASRIEEEIRSSVNEQLPYVNIINVFVVQGNDSNMVDVSIEFTTRLEPDTLDTLTFNFNIGE